MNLVMSEETRRESVQFPMRDTSHDQSTLLHSLEPFVLIYVTTIRLLSRTSCSLLFNLKFFRFGFDCKFFV